MEEIKQNDLLVATKGREPGLVLSKNRTKISLKNWANEILDEMMLIAELLDNKTTTFTNIIHKLSTQIVDQEQTLSAMLLNKIQTEKLSVDELGRSMGAFYKNQYISMEKFENSEWSLLEKESVDSKKRQVRLERASDQSFDSFVKEYFNQ